MQTCPCSTLEAETNANHPKLSYEQCCGQLHNHSKHAKTAVELMKARYSAYVKNKIQYIEETQIKHPGEDFNAQEAETWAHQSSWNGIKILSYEQGGENDNIGKVHFEAYYQDKKTLKDYVHNEKSEFKKVDGQWKFSRGDISGTGKTPITREAPKVGRNDPCACGSGKKYKKCCG